MAFLDSLKNIGKVVKTKEGNKNSENHCFCSKCGTKLNTEAKFCSACGNTLNSDASENPSYCSEAENKRHQEYIGTILKCPGCGCAITKTTAICPECGLKITGQTVVSSIEEISKKLLEIEQGKKGIFGTSKKNAKSQILLLIKTFPIPNTVDDIFEFILLANANIDVSLSKKGFWGNSSTEEAEISNAWVAKMQQVYQKAEITFPNDPAFSKIQKIYFDKMKELKIKV